MQTKTAQAIAAVEAQTNPVEQQRVLARFPADSIFRSVLALTYDPFVPFSRFDWHATGPVCALPDDLDAVNQALESEWSVFAADAHDGNVTPEWRESPAWSVYSRVLSKRLANVSWGTVNGVWGSLRAFCAAVPSSDPSLNWTDYVRVGQPVGAVRLLSVVRGLTSPSRWIEFYSPDGLCVTPVVLQHAPWLEAALATTTWPSKPFAMGVVLEGFIEFGPTRKRYGVFDVIPFQHFHDQDATAPYSTRESWLEYAKSGDFVGPAFRGPYVTGTGLAIDPRAGYPYGLSTAWVLTA